MKNLKKTPKNSFAQKNLYRRVKIYQNGSWQHAIFIMFHVEQTNYVLFVSYYSVAGFEISAGSAIIVSSMGTGIMGLRGENRTNGKIFFVG